VQRTSVALDERRCSRRRELEELSMKCKIEFQYRPKNRERPNDHVQKIIVDPTLPLPCIGDHVLIEEEGWRVVENKLFSYSDGSDAWLLINIVLTDSSVPEGRLLKTFY
jgi:hypothetical protein